MLTFLNHLSILSKVIILLTTAVLPVNWDDTFGEWSQKHWNETVADINQI